MDQRLQELRSLTEIIEEHSERSYRAADDEWKQTAWDIAIKTSYELEEWTTDELWNRGLPNVKEPRALGGILRRLSSEGIITKTDRVRTSNRHEQNHGRSITIWKSNFWDT